MFGRANITLGIGHILVSLVLRRVPCSLSDNNLLANGQIPLRYPALEVARELVLELVCDQLASWIA